MTTENEKLKKLRRKLRDAENMSEAPRKLLNDAQNKLFAYQKFCQEFTDCLARCADNNTVPVVSYWIKRTEILWK